MKKLKSIICLYGFVLCICGCGSEERVFKRVSSFENEESVEWIIVNTETDQFIITKPDIAEEKVFDEKSYSYTISNDWITVDYQYEIKDDIHSAADCERYIDTITGELPLSSAASTIEESERFELFVDNNPWIADPWTEFNQQNFSDDLMTNLEGISVGYDGDLYDIWYTSFGDDGVAYFYESCDYLENGEDVTFSKMITQACNYHDGVALLGTVEVTYFDYLSCYNSKDTTIEQNELESQYKEIMEILSHPHIKTSRGEETLTSSVDGFRYCLFTKVKLIQ